MAMFPGRAHRRALPLTAVAVWCALTFYGNDIGSQPTSGTVTGTVSAANKMIIRDARIRLLGTSLTALTRADGTFEVTRVPIGPGTIEITMIGYTPKRVAIVIMSGERLDLKVFLDPIPLAPVRVTADANFVGMEAFEERRARGSGHYFTRDDIVRMQARQLTDVLRRVPGMQIGSGRSALSGGNSMAHTGRNISGSGSAPCAMTYYVNGSAFPVSGEVSINHFVAPDDVAAIEVYTGASRIPPEFNSSIHGSRCGVIAVWTRSSLDGIAR